jgi:hypothetical protein
MASPARAVAPMRATESATVEVRIARSTAEVENLRPEWSAWGGHRDSDIDFFLMIVGSYPEVLRPHVLALYRNGQLDAILIGRLEEKRLAFKVGYISLLQPTARCLTFVYGALRGNASAENSETFVREILACLKKGEADIALLEFIPTDSPLHEKALKVPSFVTRDSQPNRQLHDVLELPDSMDSMFRRMPSNHRTEFRRRIKKLQSHPDGEMRIVCYRETSELERLFIDAEAIAKKTYQRGLGAGFADTPEVRRRLELAASKKWLRANVLYIKDRPVAFWIGMVYGDCFVGEYLGFDPDFRRFAPGMVLMLKGIENMYSQGEAIKTLDFGLGHADYKAVLCTKTWSESAIYIFSPTLSGLALKSMRTTAQIVDRFARKVLVSTALFAGVKKWWRSRLRNEGPLPPQEEPEQA